MSYDYSGKIISIEKALSLVKDGDYIVTSASAAEAHEFLMNLHKIVDWGVKDVSITTCLTATEGKYLSDPAYAGKIDVDSWFYTPVLRRYQDTQTISHIPGHLRYYGKRRLQCKKPNIFIGNASLPDKHGYVSVSLSAVYEREMWENADMIMLEINPHVPRTFGDVELHIDDVDYLIETDYSMPDLTESEPTEQDYKIGKMVAEEINDGDCIQLGIGGMPNAIAKSLYNKKDLGVHTEMLTSEIPRLFKAGVITGKKKNVYPRKMVCAFVYGSREMCDFVDNNPGVLVLRGSFVNDPHIIGLNDNQVSINSSIEIDVTGQCCSETIGTRHFSGTGGQADTAIGALNSKGGRSYICIYSTATVKDKDGGTKKISKIVPTLKQGAVVSLSRNDVDRIVTEYGIAELRGTNVRERVEKLTAIAHPDFREDIMRQSMELGIIRKKSY